MTSRIDKTDMNTDNLYPLKRAPVGKKYLQIDETATLADLEQGLSAGGLTAQMTNGCWSIWLTEKNIYCGELIQHRKVTATMHRKPKWIAITTAARWVKACSQTDQGLAKKNLSPDKNRT